MQCHSDTNATFLLSSQSLFPALRCTHDVIQSPLTSTCARTNHSITCITLSETFTMSSMRWGDSDSSDEDEIRVSSLPVPGQQGQRHAAASPPPSRRSRTPSGGPSPPRSGPPHNRDRPNKSNRNTGNRGPRQSDWKQMAKSASRFAGGM